MLRLGNLIIKKKIWTDCMRLQADFRKLSFSNLAHIMDEKMSSYDTFSGRASFNLKSAGKFCLKIPFCTENKNQSTAQAIEVIEPVSVSLYFLNFKVLALYKKKRVQF